MTEVPVRKICFCSAMSLDGYIADSNGGYDWIVPEPEIDSAMEAEFQRFDTALVGRKTFDTMVRENRTEIPGLQVIVFSRTLRPADFPGVTIIAAKQKESIEALRAKPGKDILLMGGGNLFRALLEDGLVDIVEVAIVPVLLGEGIPLLPAPSPRQKLELTGNIIYKSGIVALNYAVVG
jgi:dihydrofolate reductase